MDGDNQGTGFTYEIPDCLMHRDFIEVHGVCLGKQITFELCTKDGQAKSMPDVIPLQVVLNTSGQVTVLSRNKQKVEKQELFMKNCIQQNMNFELCVYAYEDKYEVFLNKEKVCAQKHMVELPEVFALSMDGDAEFLSVEFKDLYWEDEAGSSKLDEDVPTGFVRVQENRESARNKKGEQVMVPVRSSFRSSQQSKPGTKPGISNEVSTWRTSGDLSKPNLDRDYSLNKGQPADYVVEPPVAGPQLYATLPPYGSQQGSTYGNVDTPGSSLSKSKGGVGGSRKSITLGDDKPERLSIGGDIHPGNYRPVDDQYGVPRGSTMGTTTLVTASTPTLQEKSKKKRFSLLSKHRKSKGSEPDIRASVQEDTGSDVKLRKSRGSAFDVRPKDEEDGKKKKKFSFKNIFKRKKSKDSVEITPTSSGSATFNNRPSYQQEIYENLNPTLPAGAVASPKFGDQPKDLLKRQPAEISAYMHSNNNYPNLKETTLTGRSPSDLGYKLRGSQDLGYRSPSISNEPSRIPQPTTRVSAVGAPESPSSIKVGKLKGSAPEMASMIYSYHPDKYEHNTTLTELGHRPYADSKPNIIKADNDYSLPPAAPVTQPTTIMTNAPGTTAAAPAKLKGNSADLASQILRNNPQYDDDNLYYTNLTGMGGPAGKKSPAYQRNISIDRDVDKPILKPAAPSTADDTPTYAYTTSIQKTRQAVSLPEYDSDEEQHLSEGSTVYTDGEYYLEVGKSAYYFERKRSLKNYRSRRSVKQEKAARHQMGLSNGDSDSALSSISSLKPDDPKMTPRAGRRRVGQGSKEVRSWLDSQSPEYQKEGKIMPTAASTRVVYADAPSVQSDQIDKYSTKDFCETFLNKDVVEFPIPLIPGREAMVTGSFLKTKEPHIQSGVIKLICSQPASDNDSTQTDNLFVEVWTNGCLELFIKSGTHKQIIHRLNESQDSMKNESGRFTLRLNKQSLYLGITWNNECTLLVQNSVLANSPHAIKVEEPTSILLDQLIVAKCLTLPLCLVLPPDCHGYHNLELITKLTSDSKEIGIKYHSANQENNLELSLTMDLVQFKIYISHTAESSVRIQPADIPFVPEQIKSIGLCLSKKADDCSMKVKLNNTDLVTTVLGPAHIVSQLTGVRISGDLQLLDTQMH